jgi:P pilus assembly chaperone PapD
MFFLFKKHASIISLICVSFFSTGVFSAVRPQLTRIVASVGQGDTPVEIINESDEPYMLQAWLEDLNGNDSDIPLVLTPPVMRLNGKASGKLRLVVIPSGIPHDRESVYWLSLQEIPPKSKNGEENKLVIAIRSKLKVFVRPKGFTEKEASIAVTRLKWEVQRDAGKVWLKAVNPTPYYVSFGKFELKVGDKVVTLNDKVKMPPPMESQRYEVPRDFEGKSVTLTYNAINDYGGASDDLSVYLTLL